MWPRILMTLGRSGPRIMTALKEWKLLKNVPFLAKIEGAVVKSSPASLKAVRAVEKSMPNVVPKSGMLSKLFKGANLRKAGQLKKIVKNPFLAKLLNWGVTASMVYPLIKDWFSDPEIASNPEAVEQIKQTQAAYESIAELTPHVEIDAYTAMNSAITPLERNFTELIKRLFIDRSFLTGNEFSEDNQAFISSLDDQERIYIISVLNGITKGLCDDTDASELLNAYRIQNALSDQMFSVPTKGFDYIIKAGNTGNNLYEAAALQYSATISSFSEELSQAAFQDFFDKTTNVFFDLKDLFGGDTGANWSEDKEEFSIVRVNAQVSCLSTDSNLNTITGMFDKWATDEDGKDDESAAIRAQVKYQSVADNYRWIQRNYAKGDAVRATTFISQT